MLQFFRKRRGSALAMMLIIMAILTTLGVSILSATLMGHRFKVINNREKTAFYVSEAGLEEAYAYLGEEVENAIEYAQQIYIPGQMGATTTDAISSGTEERTPEQKQALTEAEYTELTNLYFQIGYQWYFTQNSAIIVNNLQSKLLSTIGRLIGQNGVRVDAVICALDPASVSGNAFAGGQIRFNFQTRVRRANLDGTFTPAMERIDCTLSVGIPNYQAPFMKQLTQFSIMHNALWDKALATDRNIYVLSDVTVHGNVYAYGDDINSTQPQMKGHGGIVVGGVNDRTLSTPDAAVRGTLTVNSGNVVTDKEVVTLVSSSVDPSEVTINGDLYCNSLVASSGLSGGSSPNTGSRITITGDISILDDTELNSEDSRITVNGSYFGFSSGSGADLSHNSSSSLVVNAEDIADPDKSAVIITGGGDKYTDILPTSVKLAPGGIYLSGTVYVNDQTTYTGVTDAPDYGTVTVNSDGKYRYIPTSTPPGGVTTDNFIVATLRSSEIGSVADSASVTVNLDGLYPVEGVISASYQTGDSVSVVGNYLGYAQTLTPPTDARFTGIDSTFFTEYWPLNLISHKNGTTGKEEMDHRDKADYSMLAKVEYAPLFNFGGGNIQLHGTSINNNQVKFSLGTYINRISATVGDMFDDKHSLADVVDVMLNIHRDYNFNTRWAGDPQEIGYMDSSTTIGYRPLRHWLVSDWNRTDGTNSFVTSASGADNKVFYAKNTPGSDEEVLILRGANYDSDEYANLVDRITNTEHKTAVLIDMPNADTVQVTGVILAKDDVYVLGDVDYAGLVMAQGDIWLIDDNPKIFSNLDRGQGGTFNGSIWEHSNPVVDMVFDDIARHASDFQLGDFFTQSLNDPNGSAWAKEITREMPTASAFIQGQSYSYAGSMNGIIQVTGWQRSNQRD